MCMDFGFLVSDGESIHIHAKQLLYPFLKHVYEMKSFGKQFLPFEVDPFAVSVWCADHYQNRNASTGRGCPRLQNLNVNC